MRTSSICTASKPNAERGRKLGRAASRSSALSKKSAKSAKSAKSKESSKSRSKSKVRKKVGTDRDSAMQSELKLYKIDAFLDFIL